MSYITCEFRGRLGNNLFMMANVIAQSIRHKKPFLFSKQDVFYYEMYKDNVYRKIDFTPMTLQHQGVFVAEPKFTYFPITPNEREPTIFRGYFQSEKYFSEYEEVIRWMFEPTEDFKQQMYTEFPELSSEEVVCINVRRGADYLAQTNRHPVVSSEYIYEAIKHIPNANRFFVVSDDLSWCKENIKLPNCTFVEYDEWKALWLMSLCHHFIISNSTYSWWAAYLSRHKNKIVVSPSTWFGPDCHDDPQDVYCDGWIKLPTKYHEGTIIPITL